METMDDWIAMGRSTFEKDTHPTFGLIVIYPDSHDASVTACLHPVYAPISRNESNKSQDISEQLQPNFDYSWN